MEQIKGILVEKLVIQTDNELIVIPAGVIIEFSSNDEFEHQTTNKSIKDAVEYLAKNE